MHTYMHTLAKAACMHAYIHAYLGKGGVELLLGDRAGFIGVDLLEDTPEHALVARQVCGRCPLDVVLVA